MKRVLIAVIYLSLFHASPSRAETITGPGIWPQLKYGTYAVGFDVVRLQDHARPYYTIDNSPDRSLARPVQFFVWYPADSASATPVTWGDYIRLGSLKAAPWEQTEDLLQEEARRLYLGNDDSTIIIKRLPEILKTVTAATRQPQSAEGNFPLILFGSGAGSRPSIYAELAEYLASHGYVVAAMQGLAELAEERWPFDQRGIDLQLDDSRMVLNELLTWPNVDQERIGLAAWSVGGVTQAILQMHNPQIRAIVSLDGATGYEFGAKLLRGSPLFDSASVNVPIYQARGLAPEQYDVPRDFSYIDSLATNTRYLLSFNHLVHADFRPQSVRLKEFIDSESTKDIVADYRWLARSTLWFFNGYLNSDSNALDSLSNIDTFSDVSLKSYLSN